MYIVFLICIVIPVASTIFILIFLLIFLNFLDFLIVTNHWSFLGVAYIIFFIKIIFKFIFVLDLLILIFFYKLSNWGGKIENVLFLSQIFSIALSIALAAIFNNFYIGYIFGVVLSNLVQALFYLYNITRILARGSKHVYKNHIYILIYCIIQNFYIFGKLSLFYSFTWFYVSKLILVCIVVLTYKIYNDYSLVKLK